MTEVVLADVRETYPSPAGDDLRAIARDVGFLLDGIVADQVTTNEVKTALEILCWRLERSVQVRKLEGSSARVPVPQTPR
jgi:hypothetical protein